MKLTQSKKRIGILPILATTLMIGLSSTDISASPSSSTTDTWWGVDFYRNYDDIPADVVRLCHHFYREWVDTNHDSLMQPEERYNAASKSHRLMLSNTGIVYVNPAKRQYWLDRVQNIAQIVRLVPEGTNNTAAIDIDVLDSLHDVETNITNIGDLYGLEGPGTMDDSFDCGEHQDPSDPLYCQTSEGLPARTGTAFQDIAAYLDSLTGLGLNDFTSIGPLTDAGFIAFNSWTNPFAAVPNGYYSAEIYFANLSCTENYISDAKPIMPDLPKANCGEDGIADIVDEAVWMPSITDWTRLHLVKSKDVENFYNM